MLYRFEVAVVLVYLRFLAGKRTAWGEIGRSRYQAGTSFGGVSHAASCTMKDENTTRKLVTQMQQWNINGTP
jgi:hypothetical protein